MRSFQKKRGFWKIMRSKPVLSLLIVLLFIFVWEVIGFMGKMTITIENRKIAENKVAELEKRKRELSVEIDKLKTVSGIEESIRKKFPVAKDGEGVVVILENTSEPKTSDESSGGFFYFLKKFFK